MDYFDSLRVGSTATPKDEIDDFSQPQKPPHIALSVDMLDTGIDVLEVVNHLAIHRLRTNQPLTPADLAELERMLLESGVGSPTDLTQAKESASGLGRFVRSLIGLDRAAAKAAFAQFLNQQNATANQIEFINLIIDHLTNQGTMAPELLYESPFTDLHPLGVEGVFGPQAAELVEILEEIERRSAA